MRTVFEAAGGNEGLYRLAAAWHRRVMADEVVSHAFSHGFHPQHIERLAAYWAEALGGPGTYSGTYGDETQVVRMHSGNGEHDEMNRRAIACFDQALEDTGLAGDAALRQVLHDYFAWATTTTMYRYHGSADDVPAGLSIPRWSWDGLQGMPGSVKLQTVQPRKLAAVRRSVAPGGVGSAWRPALDKVWEFLRRQPGLRTDGHNIFLYRHAVQPGAPMVCDFGVEVTRTFETAGEVYATETPGGEAAVAVHRGTYDRLRAAHDAIGAWMAANRRESAGCSWEIYGDPTPDPSQTETTVVYLLK